MGNWARDAAELDRRLGRTPAEPVPEPTPEPVVEPVASAPEPPAFVLYDSISPDAAKKLLTPVGPGVFHRVSMTPERAERVQRIADSWSEFWGRIDTVTDPRSEGTTGRAHLSIPMKQCGIPADLAGPPYSWPAVSAEWFRGLLRLDTPRPREVFYDTEGTNRLFSRELLEKCVLKPGDPVAPDAVVVTAADDKSVTVEKNGVRVTATAGADGDRIEVSPAAAFREVIRHRVSARHEPLSRGRSPLHTVYRSYEDSKRLKEALVRFHETFAPPVYGPGRRKTFLPGTFDMRTVRAGAVVEVNALAVAGSVSQHGAAEVAGGQ